MAPWILGTHWKWQSKTSFKIWNGWITYKIYDHWPKHKTGTSGLFWRTFGGHPQYLVRRVFQHLTTSSSNSSGGGYSARCTTDHHTTCLKLLPNFNYHWEKDKTWLGSWKIMVRGEMTMTMGWNILSSQDCLVKVGNNRDHQVEIRKHVERRRFADLLSS